MTADRYRRQKAYSKVGDEGQQKLRDSHVLICGVGALGSTIAERLCRAGVGKLTLIDRDWVELDNLPRQALYTEEDARNAAPKGEACAAHLASINSEVSVEFHVVDLHSGNIRTLFEGVDCIADGTDNFEVRYLINDYACATSTPWVHAGIVGASGQSLTIVPGATACFRCLLPDPPPAEQMQTCDSAGVLGPAVGLIANWQAMEILKLLLEGRDGIDGDLRVFDLWRGDMRRLKIDRLVPADEFAGCPTCVKHRFEFLNGQRETRAKALCGRNGVQIQSPEGEGIDLQAIANRLASECEIKANSHFLRFELDGLVWTVFQDGRAILSGTEDIELARKLYARRIGS